MKKGEVLNIEESHSSHWPNDNRLSTTTTSAAVNHIEGHEDAVELAEWGIVSDNHDNSQAPLPRNITHNPHAESEPKQDDPNPQAQGQEAPQGIGQYKDTGPDILQTLDIINKKLQKLDTLDSMTALLKGGLSSVQDKVDGITAQMGAVKSDLQRCEEKWEAGVTALSGRIEILEKQ